MKSWQQALRHGLFSGSLASLASTAVLSVCGHYEEGSASAPSNATSHWVWGKPAFHRDAPSLRFTLVGYGIHHATSCFWAVLYERWLTSAPAKSARRSPLAGGAAIALLACFTDYYVVPRRLRPGFEKRLSKPALFLAYAAFGVTLGLCRRRARASDAS